jgi:hypothetical protein
VILTSSAFTRPTPPTPSTTLVDSRIGCQANSINQRLCWHLLHRRCHDFLLLFHDSSSSSDNESPSSTPESTPIIVEEVFTWILCLIHWYLRIIPLRITWVASQLLELVAALHHPVPLQIAPFGKSSSTTKIKAYTL